MGVFFFVCGCARTVSELTLQAKHTPPSTPTLSAPPTIIAGATNVTAAVVNPVANLNYDWTVVNATLTSALRGTSITFTAGSAGSILYTVNVSNEVGDTAAPASASSLVVQGIPASYLPTLTVPPRVIAGRGGNRVELGNVLPGLTYVWSALNGQIDSHDDVSAAFTGANPGQVTIVVTASVTGATGASVSAQVDVEVDPVPAPALTAVAGQLGGVGYLDGPLSVARIPTPPSGNEVLNILAGPDGTIWYADAHACVVRQIKNGIVTTIGMPYDCRLLGATVDGIASAARFMAPSAMAAADDGAIWVVDNSEPGAPYSAVLRKITTEGAVSTFGTAAVSATNCTSEDSGGVQLPLAQAVFCNGPTGVATIAGDLYVASSGSLRVYPHDGSVAKWLFVAGSGGCIDTITVNGTTPETAPTAENNVFSRLTSDSSYVYWSTPQGAMRRYDPTSKTATSWPSPHCAQSFTSWFYNESIVPQPNGPIYGVAASGVSLVAYSAALLGGFSWGSGQPVPQVIAGDADEYNTSGQGAGDIDAPGTAAKFSASNNKSMHLLDIGPSPHGAAEMSLYLADIFNSAIRVVAPDGSSVSTLLQHPAHPGFANGRGAQASFKAPSAVAVAFDHTVYVADSGNGALRRLDPDGTVSTLFGSGVSLVRDGSSALAALANVTAMLIMPNHDVWFADGLSASPGSMIRRYVPSTGEVSTLLGSTSPGFTDGGAANAALRGATAMALAPDGTVVVTDTPANAVRIVTASGELVTLVSGANGDLNAGFSSTFSQPRGVAVASDGTIYVSDTGNAQIRRLSLSSAGLDVSLVAGPSTPIAFGCPPQPQDGRCLCDATTDSTCALSARLRLVTSLQMRANGDLVLLELPCNASLQGSPVIRVVRHPEDAAACTVATVAGQSDPRFHAVATGLLSAAPTPSFNSPGGFAQGALQDFWLTDTVENAVLELELPQ